MTKKVLACNEKQLSLIRKRPFRISVAWGLCQLVGLEEKSRPQGATVEVCQEKETQFIFHRSASVSYGSHSKYDIFCNYLYIHISNLLSGDRDRIEVVGHSIKSRVEVWIEVENIYPTSISQLRDSINESNAQSRVVSSITQDTIQQLNAQPGMGRDCPLDWTVSSYQTIGLVCIRAETIQLVCTPSTSKVRCQVETIHFLAVRQ